MTIFSVIRQECTIVNDAGFDMVCKHGGCNCHTIRSLQMMPKRTIMASRDLGFWIFRRGTLEVRYKMPQEF